MPFLCKPTWAESTPQTSPYLSLTQQASIPLPQITPGPVTGQRTAPWSQSLPALFQLASPKLFTVHGLLFPAKPQLEALASIPLIPTSGMFPSVALQGLGTCNRSFS